MMQRGRFITLEGIEGLGKSTIADFIQAQLQAAGIDVQRTREPGGTPIAEEIRQLVLAKHEEPLLADTELLLMFAGRAQHTQSLIVPALESGQWILSDRFVDASFAYQGGGRHIPRRRIEALAQWVLGDLEPDLTILLDAPVSVGIERMRERGKKDRIESEAVEFFERVRSAYLEEAAHNADRFRIVDASQSLDAVQAAVMEHLNPLIKG